MRALHLSGSILVLAHAVTAGSGASAQTTSRYPAPASGTVPYPGQSPVPSPYTVQPLSDADRLASEIRLLAAEPDNVPALVRAGELALKLHDDTAAATFFARAERIDPRNGRVKAGEGSLLVAAERPGEALRRFAEAQSYGADPRGFAADRGLAYDLLGEQDRAQRDYRVALRAGPNDETQRRYALSLGISGKRDLALVQIDPLLRKSDRGAWRSRAFILAMSGDKAGAEKIATSMMPNGLSQGLLPFFELLPTLRPADRAFAVHFGEVRATPERFADARLAPPLAMLAPDPSAPVEVAAVAARPVAVAARPERASRRKRDRFVAVTTPPPQPLPTPPLYTGQPVVLAPDAARPPAYAPVTPRQTPTQRANLTSRSTAPAASSPLPSARPPVVASAGYAVASIVKPVVPMAQPTAIVAVPTAPLVPAPERNVVVASATPTAPPGADPSTPAVPVAVVPPPAPTPVRSEESILAAIIADIKVPGAELQPEPTVAPVRAIRPATVAVPPSADRAESDRRAKDKKAADKKAADKQALAERKAVTDKKAADAKKVAAAKQAAEEKRKNDPKILEPSRVWVQVSGGANAHDLPKQWAKVRAQSKAFGVKGGWTTPLRATNRILTGPFKSDGEAQGFVNTIAKDGLAGFVFVSDAGQKITKLAAK